MDIPGYWYDKEKNRYFRIMNNPATQSPSDVSLAKKAKDKVKSDKQQQQKKQSLTVDRSNAPITIEMCHCPLLEKLRRPYNDGGVDMTKLLILREYQHLGLTQSKRLIYSSIPRLLDTKSPVVISMEGETKAIAINPAGTLLATYVECEYTVNFLKCCNNLWMNCDRTLFARHRGDAVPVPYVITDIQFVSLGGEEVLAFANFASRGGGVEVINTPYSWLIDDPDQYNCKVFFRWNNCFAFSWNSDRNVIALGGHKGISLRSIQVDQNIRHIYTHSHVLSTQLGSLTPYIACGTRSGEILLWDSRNIDSDSTAVINLQVHGRIGNSVTGLNMLHDENYLVSSSANGKLLQWDLRMRRVVLPFSHGVRDQSTFNYNKSIVDSEETLLFSATPSSINVWSLLNGCKLQTIPLSVDGHYQLQSPVMCYTNNFSGAGHYTTALIISIGASLKAFTFKNFYH